MGHVHHATYNVHSAKAVVTAHSTPVHETVHVPVSVESAHVQHGVAHVPAVPATPPTESLDTLPSPVLPTPESPVLPTLDTPESPVLPATTNDFGHQNLGCVSLATTHLFMYGNCSLFRRLIFPVCPT